MNELPPILQPGEKVTNTWIGQLLRAIRRQTPIAGPGLKAKVTPAGTVLSAEAPHAHAAGGGGPAPFALRYYKLRPSITGTTRGTRRWSVYLPPGSLSVGGNCVPLNRKMADIEGHEDDGADWYDLPGVETGAPIVSYTEEREVDDGNGGTLTETVNHMLLDVVAHGKTSAKVYGVDALGAPARRMMYVGVRPVRPADAQPLTAQQEAQDCWGDEFEQIVGRIDIAVTVRSGSIVSTSRSFARRVAGAVSVAGSARTNFDLEWYFTTDADTGALNCEKVYCVRVSQSTAGMDLTGPGYVDVTDAAGTIYARIDVNGAAENVLDVVLDPDSTGGGDLVTWLKLYDMSFNTVKADYRASSLVNVQTFR